MPRLTQAVPKYRLHKQSGQAITTINGRDHLLGPHGTKASKFEYDRLITEWLSSGRSSTFGAPEQGFTVVELIADYLAYARVYYGDAPRGTFTTMKIAVRPLNRLYGRTLAGEFGVVEFKAVRHLLSERDVSRGYVNELMSRIVAVFRWAAAEGKIPAHVPQTIAIIPGLRKGRTNLRETEPVRPVDIDVVKATLPYLSPVVSAMVRFQLATGARPGEVCKLTPGVVDRSGDVWEARLVEHKTAHHGKDRTIYVGPQAQEILAPYLLRSADAVCFSPGEAVEWMRPERAAARRTPLSCGNRAGTNRRSKPKRNTGERYTTQSYGVAIARACDKAYPHPELAGIRISMLTTAQKLELKAWQKAKRWAPNQLRHTAATRVRREFDLDSAKTILGHSSTAITEVYAEKDRSKAIEVARKIG